MGFLIKDTAEQTHRHIQTQTYTDTLTQTHAQIHTETCEDIYTHIHTDTQRYSYTCIL